MGTDLDRYYTPVDLAESLISSNFKVEPSVCVDSTCGSGNLLEAASNVFENVKCVGLDRDKSAINALKRKNPNWTLSVADLMNKGSYSRTLAVADKKRCDLLLLNPPFSQSRNKSVGIDYCGEEFRGSVAMAHILKSVEIFNPQHGAMIIVPESVLYSEVDAVARKCLEKKFSINLLDELDNKTFMGARVRSSVIKLTHGVSQLKGGHAKRIFPRDVSVELIRGGLPVHQAFDADLSVRDLVPFLHTTDLSGLDSASLWDLPRWTSEKRKGRVAGNFIFLPRVGLPTENLINAIHASSEVQLSDCVFALRFSTIREARVMSEFLNSNRQELLELYRGTGARYLTISRLSEWLGRRGVVVF